MIVFVVYQQYAYDGEDVLGLFDNLNAAVDSARFAISSDTWTNSGNAPAPAVEMFSDSPHRLFSSHIRGKSARVGSMSVKSTFGV